MEEKYMMMLL